MSEKSSKAAASKSSDSAKSKPAAPSKESAKSADSGSSAKEADKPGSNKSEKGKSQKETVSSSDVHYGYFSSVRTPAYRQGWDEIFGKKKKSSGSKARKNSYARPARKKKKAAIKQPVTLELDIDELPEELRAALSDEVKRKVKRRSINFDKRDAAGAVRWNITCEIDR